MILKRVLQSLLIVAVLLVSLAATPQNAKANSYCGPTYVVQPGDWLAKIARYCGVSTSALIAANPWTQYYYYIYPGQVLNIPDAYYPPPSPPPGPPPDTGGPYVCGPNYDMYGAYWYVCRGDTLGKIARYYGVSWQYLQYHNGIYNPNIIYPGQIIRP
jgi:LysM repeat protein